MMNETLRVINERVSIHGGFLDKDIPEKIIDIILDAGIRAPTASSMQRYAIIIVKDKEKQKAIGAYPSSVVFVFCVDVNRWIKMYGSIGENYPFDGVKQLLTGISDALLCAQNIVVAAQSLGIGSCFTNSIFRKGSMTEIFKILNIPNFVFPVIALRLGYPKEWPKKKKFRLTQKGIIHHETYLDFSKEDINEIINEYNSKNVIGEMNRKRISQISGFKNYFEWFVNLYKKQTLKPTIRRDLWNSLIRSGFFDPKHNGLKPENK